MTPQAICSDRFQFSSPSTSEGDERTPAVVFHAFDNAHLILGRQIGFDGQGPLLEIALREHGNERRRMGDSVDMTRARKVTVLLRVKSGEGELMTSRKHRTRVSREDRTVRLIVSAIYVTQTMRGKQPTTTR